MQHGAGAIAQPTPLLLALLLAACAGVPDRDAIDERERDLYGDERAPELADEPGRRGDGAPARAPDLPGSADLDDYVRVALERSGVVRAAFEDWRAQTERVEQVGTLPEPRFTWSEYLEEVQTRTGPQERSFGVAQTIPWPGTLGARARVADEEAGAHWHRVEAARLAVARDVELAYLEYAFLARELEIRRAQAELLRDLEGVVQARFRAGSAGQEDLLRLQVEVGRLDDDVARLERRRPAASARLAAAINLPSSSPVLPLPVLDEPPSAAPVDVAAAVERALDSNPELLALTRAVQARREGRELAGIDRWPDLTLGLTAIQTGDAVAPGTPGSGDDPVILSLSLPLPVWASSDAAHEREAAHRLRAAHARLDQARADLVARVERAAYDRDDASRRVALYRDSLVPRAEEALQLTSTAYRSGGVSVLDVIDSERALLEFRLSYWQACRASHEARAVLDSLAPAPPEAEDL